MTKEYQKLLNLAYDAFNARDIKTVLSLMHEDVIWPNGWEGGYVKGHDEVSSYWTRQWKEIDPNVKPVSFTENKNGQIEIEVHQTVKSREGNVLFDGLIKHIYTIENDKIKSMEIEKL